MNEGWYEQEMGIKRAIADAIKGDYYTNIELGDFRVDIDEIFIMLATLYDFDMIRVAKTYRDIPSEFGIPQEDFDAWIMSGTQGAAEAEEILNEAIQNLDAKGGKA